MGADFDGDFHAVSGYGDLNINEVADFWNTQVYREIPSRMQIVREPRRRGNFSLQTTLHQDDNDHNGTTERISISSTQNSFAPGEEIWIAFSIMLDASFPMPQTGDWLLVLQMFGLTGGQSTGSPPIAIEIVPGGQFSLTVRGGVKATPADSAPTQSFTSFASVTRGKWHDFILHVKFATDATGLTEVWHREAGGTFGGSPDVSKTQVNVLTVGGVVQNSYVDLVTYRKTRVQSARLWRSGVRVRTRGRAHAEAFLTDWLNYANEVTADTPDNLWWLSESSGTNTTDSGSGVKNGTYTNSPTLNQAGGIAQDAAKKAVNFSPASSYVALPSLSGISAGSVTLEFLIQQVSPSGIQTIFSEGLSSSGNNYLWAYINAGRPGVQISDSSGATTSLSPPSSSYPGVDGKFHHYAIVLERSTSIRWYIDGKLNTSAALGNPTLSTNQAAIGVLRRSTLSSYMGNNSLQAVALYKKVLSDDRIQAHADAMVRQATTSLPAGPVAYHGGAGSVNI